jgi:hypothetical protein
MLQAFPRKRRADISEFCSSNTKAAGLIPAAFFNLIAGNFFQIKYFPEGGSSGAG